jgi:hypothetical protein
MEAFALPLQPMNKTQSFFSRIPFYILITGIYPVLFLWMVNFIRVPGYVAPRSLLISLAFTVIVFFSTWLVIRPLPRAALVSFVWLVLFFTYGHLFALVDNMQVSGFLAGRHRFFVPLWATIGILATFLILRSKSDHKNATQALNIVLTLLLALTGLQIGFAAARQGLASHPAPVQAAPAAAQTGTSAGRDVYYFLLDGYSRLDRMRDFGVDNQPFLDKLTQMGFVIPNCGQSNYTDTESSMAANLNMDYLDKLGFTYPQLAPTGSNREYLLTPSITSSLVRQKFEALGYKFISYKSPYLFIDMPNSDVYLDAETATNPGEKIETLNFQQMFINTTLARVLVEWLEFNPANSARVPAFVVWLVSPSSLNPDSSPLAGRNYRQYQNHLFQLESLSTIPDIPGKKFTYAHILVTHQPFVFTPTGEFRLEARDDTVGYHDQVLYLNTRLIEIVQNILNKSKIPPVIILQSDHAYGEGAVKVKNFQAYYFPDNGKSMLYPSMTSVNTFRMVFDTYFGEHLPLLPDQSLLLDTKYPGGYKIVPPSCVTK